MQGSAHGFVGRQEEVRALNRVLDSARTGTSASILLSGEAGVGKSSLLAHARDGLADEWAVVSVGCVPTTSRVAPLTALRSALRRVTSGLPPVPDLSAERAADAAFLVDAWVDEVTLDRPLLLCVDDVQWADASTLDVLMYLLAGPGNRQLAVVTTLRRDALADGHPMHPWLAKVIRSPGMVHLPVGALTPAGTHELVAHVVGGEPHGSLVGEVHERAGGNPYLTTLLATGLSPSTRHLPTELPADLASAVIGSWHTLDKRTRQLCTALAVGGVPLTRAQLAELVRTDPPDLNEPLADAIGVGLLDESAAGTFWFHHPLQAEGLVAGGSASERADWHSRYADVLSSDVGGTGWDPAERLGLLAAHQLGAGRPAAAFDSATAAVAAAPAGSPLRMSLARQALDVAPSDTPAGTSTALLRTLLDDAVSTGDLDAQAHAVDTLLGRTADDQPLERALLLLAKAKLDELLLRPSDRRARCDEAVALSSVAAPGSWQHTEALATRASMGWPNTRAVQRDAEAAATQHDPDADPPRVAAMVTLARLFSGGLTGDGALVASLAPVVRELSSAVRDWWAWQAAGNFEWGVLEQLTPEGYAAAVEELRRVSDEQDVPLAIRCAVDDLDLIRIERDGGWDEVGPTVRTVMGWRIAPVNELFLRRRLALIAVRQGNLDEAAEHLRCLHELLGSTHGVSVGVEAVEAEFAWARGAFVSGIAVAQRGLELRPLSGDQTEWLVPLIARNAADLLLEAPDEPAQQTARAHLDVLRDRFAVDPGAVTARVAGDYEDPSIEDFLRGPELVYAGEVARALGLEDAATVWTRAAQHLSGQHLVWWEAYARWRAAEAHLRGRRGTADRAAAAAELRAAHRLASSLPAPPLVDLVARLATSARISLADPGSPTTTPAGTGSGLAVLTARERELLRHLVAGRTYAEIAEALVLSPKTVSSHISNMLRKTDTSNRVELAQLARREDDRAS